jgi:hypothetical protein
LRDTWKLFTVVGNTKTATVNASINRGGHFSLTEAVKNARLS